MNELDIWNCAVEALFKEARYPCREVDLLTQDDLEAFKESICRGNVLGLSYTVGAPTIAMFGE